MKRARAWRRLGVVLAVVAVLVVLAAALLPRLVATDALREQALAQAEAATGAQITLDDATVALLPHLALKLRGGTVEGTGAALRAARGDDWGVEAYRAEIGEVEVGVALRPLLGRRLEAREVRVRGPLLRIVREGRTIVARDYRLTVRDLALPLAEAVAAADAPPGERIPADLALRAHAVVGELTVGATTVTEVDADAELEDRVLEVPRIAARLDGGTLAGSATVDWDRDPWGELVFAYTVRQTPAAALLADLAPDLAARLEAVLDAEGSGSANLKDGETAKASLDLTGTASAGEGVLHAADWLRDVSPYLGKRQDLKDIRFSSLQHAYRVERGRYLVNGLELDGADTAWRAEGAVDLDGTLDLGVSVKLPPGFTPELGAWSFLAENLRDADGRVQLDLLLSGPAARPAVGVDLSRLKAGAKEAGGEAVKEGVGRLLDKWKSK